MKHMHLAIFGGLAALVAVMVVGCIGNSNTAPTDNGSGSGRASDARRAFPLDTLPTAQVQVNDTTLEAWVVDNDQERAEGLMFVPDEELANDEAMLFVFPNEQMLGFWMLNTITPLDIAYARMDGTIVTIWQMPPLTIQSFPSLEPAMFALEAREGTFERLGIREGDQLIIPEAIIKSAR